MIISAEIATQMFDVIEKWDKCHSKLSYVIGDVIDSVTNNVTNPAPMEQCGTITGTIRNN